MLKKALLAVVVLFLVGSAGLFFWARSVFTHDTVRTTLAAELSEALGQPVTIGSISAGIYPRVTVKLGDVVIGQPAGVQISTLNVGTDFRALLSRRIEHATAKIDGAKIQLPLIPLGTLSSSSTPSANSGTPSSAPVELVSIDEIVLSNVEVVSRGRTLHGDIELIPETGGAVTIKRMSLRADDANLEATGRLTNLAGPAGDLAITAEELNFERLLGVFNDFASDAPNNPTSARAPAARDTKTDLNVTVDAKRAQMSGITLEGLTAKAHVTDAAVELKPISFGLFGGKYDGTLTLRTGTGPAPVFTFGASLSNIDVPAVTRFAGMANDPLTGRLSGRLDVTGAGTDAAAAMRTARGTARVNIANGVVKNLGLVRAIVVATSGRGTSGTLTGATAVASTEAQASRDESFKTLSATLGIAGRSATTEDLRFDGTNVSVGARGSVALDGSAVNLSGQARLSEELTKQAGTDLVRYTRDDTGRVTLPVTVSGSAQALSVRIDVANALKRAIQNRVEDEAQKALIKGLGGLFKKPK